jgi:hypothetical protein
MSTTGADLIVRSSETVAFMSVCRNGYRIIDWLTNKPNLADDPKNIINNWLDFYQPNAGDLLISKNRRHISTAFKHSEVHPDKVVGIIMTHIHKAAKSMLPSEEYEEVTQAHGDYLVYADGGRVTIRKNNHWSTLDEILLQNQPKIKSATSNLKEQKQLFSDRGFLLAGKPAAVPVLAVEFVDKWIDLYVIHPDGQVSRFSATPKYEEVYQDMAENYPERTEGDHTWNPHFLYQVANRLGLEFAGLSLDLVAGRWTRQHDSFYE